MFSLMTHLSQDRNWTLSELSAEKGRQLTPSIVYIGHLMVFGLIGNLFVLLVYYRKFPVSTHRCFILVLALFDFMACTVGAPLIIVDMLHIYTFSAAGPCKVFRFILYYATIASSLTLVLIACERYRKICRPLQPQMSVTMAKRCLVAVSGVFSFLSSVPPLVLFGNHTIETGVRNISGTGCFLSDDYINTVYPTVYNGYLLFLGMLATVIMAVCYIAIARQVKQMSKVKLTMKGGKYGQKRGESQSENGDDDMESEAVSQDVSQDFCHSITELGKTTVQQTDSVGTVGSVANGNKKRVTAKASKWAGKVLRRISSKNNRKTLRITKMLTLVTVAFVISYLPHLSLMIANMVTGGQNLPEDNWYQLLFSSFLINNIVNPLIYAAMDQKFRRECTQLLTFHSICKKCAKS